MLYPLGVCCLYTYQGILVQGLSLAGLIETVPQIIWLGRNKIYVLPLSQAHSSPFSQNMFCFRCDFAQNKLTTQRADIGIYRSKSLSLGLWSLFLGALEFLVFAAEGYKASNFACASAPRTGSLTCGISPRIISSIVGGFVALLKQLLQMLSILRISLYFYL